MKRFTSCKTNLVAAALLVMSGYVMAAGRGDIVAADPTKHFDPTALVPTVDGSDGNVKYQGC
jgi:hypothetical protein